MSQSFRLDLLTKTGVEASAGHDVGFHAQDGGYLVLDIDEFDQAEARVVRVEKEIDIAVGGGLLAGDGAEQVELRYASPVEVGFVGA